MGMKEKRKIRKFIYIWAFEDLPSRPRHPVSAFRAGALTGGARPVRLPLRAFAPFKSSKAGKKKLPSCDGSFLYLGLRGLEPRTYRL